MQKTNVCRKNGTGPRAGIFLTRMGVVPLMLALAFSGCVSDEVPEGTLVDAYQQRLATRGSQPRVNDEQDPCEAPLGVLQPVAPEEGGLPELKIVTDPNTGQKAVSLSLEQAVTRTLANSPEIRVVSFDPEIARQEIRKAAGEFDPVQFEQFTYDKQDAPVNSYYEPGQADRRQFETGVRQRTPLGSEWSASYAFGRNWDDLTWRPIPTRYEPMLIFQLKQPLLRDAGPVNLAGVNIARLEHQVALVGFRDKAESVSGEVIVTYWRLVQMIKSAEIQQDLVRETVDTLHKVDGRREIDATDAQRMQTLAYAKIREADLLELRKQVKDAQDQLARLLADPQINTTTEVTIVPATPPELPRQVSEPAQDVNQALATAMVFNPAMQEARLRAEIAQINIEVAANQRMPRLDLIGSARTQGLAANAEDAHDQIRDGRYVSYTVGMSMEIPLGNRSREAELTRRHLERRKAIAVLHSAADQVAVQVKEKARKARTTLGQVVLQEEAAQAARMQLKALEESEPIREKLTPEFLLVKLQAQETYAQARRAHINALIEFHVAVVELARTTGTVLQLHRIENALDRIVGGEDGFGE